MRSNRIPMQRAWTGNVGSHDQLRDLGREDCCQMKRHVWQVMVVLFLFSLVASCSRSTDVSEEVRAMREEIRSLRAELEHQKVGGSSSVVSTQGIIVQAVSTSTAEFSEFLRVSRRIVSAIGTGLTYPDFGQRLVEVNASAEEALPKLVDPTQKAKVTDFVLALRDAHSLWRYKTSSDSGRIRLEKVSGVYAYAIGFPKELGDRWNSNFSDLVKKYNLHYENDRLASPIVDFGNRPELIIDRGLERVFDYATKTFGEIEKTR